MRIVGVASVQNSAQLLSAIDVFALKCVVAAMSPNP
jgi:hypothetical protein